MHRQNRGMFLQLFTTLKDWETDRSSDATALGSASQLPLRLPTGELVRYPFRSQGSARQHEVGRQLRWDHLRHPIAKAWQVDACEQGFTTAQNDGRHR